MSLQAGKPHMCTPPLDTPPPPYTPHTPQPSNTPPQRPLWGKPRRKWSRFWSRTAASLAIPAQDNSDKRHLQDDGGGMSCSKNLVLSYKKNPAWSKSFGNFANFTKKLGITIKQNQKCTVLITRTLYKSLLTGFADIFYCQGFICKLKQNYGS